LRGLLFGLNPSIVRRRLARKKTRKKRETATTRSSPPIDFLPGLPRSASRCSLPRESRCICKIVPFRLPRLGEASHPSRVLRLVGECHGVSRDRWAFHSPARCSMNRQASFQITFRDRTLSPLRACFPRRSDCSFHSRASSPFQPAEPLFCACEINSPRQICRRSSSFRSSFDPRYSAGVCDNSVYPEKGSLSRERTYHFESSKSLGRLL